MLIRLKGGGGDGGGGSEDEIRDVLCWRAKI